MQLIFHASLNLFYFMLQHILVASPPHELRAFQKTWGRGEAHVDFTNGILHNFHKKISIIFF